MSADGDRPAGRTIPARATVRRWLPRRKEGWPRCRAVLGALAAAVLLSACGGSGAAGDGPLDGLDGLGTATDDYRVGQQFATGLAVIFNPTHDTIVIDAVRPVPGDGSLRYLGAKVAGYDRTSGSTDLYDGWPVQGPEFGPLRDAAGYAFEPGDAASKRGVELLLGYEVTEAGRSTLRGVEVEYRIGGTRYAEQFQVTLAVCAANAGDVQPVDECEFEYRDVS